MGRIWIGDVLSTDFCMVGDYTILLVDINSYPVLEEFEYAQNKLEGAAKALVDILIKDN